MIYDCIDPCFDSAAQAQFDREEACVARQARLIFCTAEVLRERMQALHSKVYLLPNACSEDEYAPSRLELLPRPACLVGNRLPVVGYMGTFDSRVDVELLVEAARQLPEFRFVLVGRINSDQTARVEPLRSLKNVAMPGAVSREEGLAYVAAFDIGLVPFLAGPVGDAINPVKMWMYLRAGKPVVSTWLRECRNASPWATAAPDVAGFVQAIRNAAVDPTAGADSRIHYARMNTWSVRAENALQILQDEKVLGPG